MRFFLRHAGGPGDGKKLVKYDLRLEGNAINLDLRYRLKYELARLILRSTRDNLI